VFRLLKGMKIAEAVVSLARVAWGACLGEGNSLGEGAGWCPVGVWWRIVLVARVQDGGRAMDPRTYTRTEPANRSDTWTRETIMYPSRFC